MRDFQGGTWVTLETRTEVEGVDLVCIGYKYNKRKVITFFLQEEPDPRKRISRI